MCPHATKYMSSHSYIRVFIVEVLEELMSVSSLYLSLNKLLYVCSDTSIYESARSYICVVILQLSSFDVSLNRLLYVSSRFYISSVLTLLYVSSCYRCWRSSRLYRASIYPSTTSTRTTRAKWLAPSAIASAHSTFSTLHTSTSSLRPRIVP